MFRALLYGSYRKPRELIWSFGIAIFPCLMVEAIMGYLLPRGPDGRAGPGRLSIGPDLAVLIHGDYVVSDATLNRFFSIHVVAIRWCSSTSSPATSSCCTKWDQGRPRRH